jgi:pimeloyl-ACP methyl ester carboxylesterase
MSNPPTLLFIPGAWHKPTCYGKIVKLLQEQHKLKCISITLPTTNGNPAATFKDDLDTARAAISNETTHDRDVVVIAHSYGGMVGNSAIKGFAKSVASSSSPIPTSTSTGAQPEDPNIGHVIGLILIASGFTLTGMTFMDPFFNQPPPAWRVNTSTGYADLIVPPGEMFYHDLPADEAEYWVSQLTTQSLGALFEGREVAYAGWRDVPAWYIGTVEDRGLPVVLQRVGVGIARGMGGRVVHREMQTSHSPFLSRPEETVGIVLEAVAAFMEEKAGHEVTVGGRGDATVSFPEARLWQPISWYRFGLPLVFGHMLGWGVLIFSWAGSGWGSKVKQT